MEALGEIRMALKSNDPRATSKWKSFRLAVLHRDNYTCHYCGSDEYPTVDHIIPISAAPELAFSFDNCVTACRSCNSSKGSRNQGSFLASISTPSAFPACPSPTESVPMLDSPFKTRPNPIGSQT